MMTFGEGLQHLLSVDILRLIVPYLSAADRFVVGQACRGLRAVVLSDEYEREAFMEFLKMSILWERPWIYYPFEPLPLDNVNKSRHRMTQARLQCLGHIKSWHCLCARSARLAPLSVQINVSPHKEIDTSGAVSYERVPIHRAGETLGMLWRIFLHRASDPKYVLHLRWYIWMIATLRSQRFPSDPFPTVAAFLKEIDFIEGTSSWNEAWPHLGPNIDKLSVNEFFSWQYATAISEENAEAPNFFVLEGAHTRWLKEMAEQYLIPKVLEAGFKPTCPVDRDWLDGMSRGLIRDAQILTIVPNWNAYKIYLFGENQCCLTFATSRGGLWEH
eukprot:Blabericola_migrator_1__7341@NODE_3731_length_1548_cov_281_235652_g2318_i0_p1_GENE_NODE_3731_length_1548_cov_281_235652_g2318_i0NODE_3731_length_1548_cov_281_235652_g2318_i0_p1_ORF_typecomplete_len330_score47_90Fbox/PF00646_33/0_016Fbox/PF00646_33/5_8e03Fboxlike/PF12937_7/0_082_NODE_3731_length_1548_cov_281_235652_g2318_i05371526